jgi:hypothetical protein
MWEFEKRAEKKKKRNDTSNGKTEAKEKSEGKETAGREKETAEISGLQSPLRLYTLVKSTAKEKRRASVGKKENRE